MNWVIALILFIISWLIVGALSTIWLCVTGVKQKKFDEEYLDKRSLEIILLILSGYVTLFIIIITLHDKKDTNEHKLFTKFIYKLVNTKKDGDSK